MAWYDIADLANSMDLSRYIVAIGPLGGPIGMCMYQRSRASACTPLNLG